MLYSYRGKVRHGKNRGKSLGFPTINIHLHKLIPEGIYVSVTKFEGRKYKSVSFVGAAKTFGETEVLSETYVFDFNCDIYGKWVRVKFLKKIRGSKEFKYDSEQELLERMEKDKKAALKFFETNHE